MILYHLRHLVLVFIHGEVALPDERLESRSKPKTVLNRASLVMSFIPLILVLAMTAQNATRNPQCQASVTKVRYNRKVQRAMRKVRMLRCIACRLTSINV